MRSHDQLPSEIVSDDTPMRVMLAAGPIFAEKGCDGATVREICAAAGTNIASINYHFGDKESLYHQTVKLAHMLRLEQVPPPKPDANATPEQRLRQFVELMLTRMLGRNELDWQNRLMMRELLDPTAACQPLVEEFIRPQLNQLLRILDDLLPDEVPAHRRHQTAFSIVGQCLHYKVAREFVSLLIPADVRERHYAIEQLADHITQFSLKGIRAAATENDT